MQEMSQLNRSLSVSRRHAVIGAETQEMSGIKDSENQRSVASENDPSRNLTEDEEDEEWLEEMRGWLLTVAALIATCAYTASLSPPGGYWQEDGEIYDKDNGVYVKHVAGNSILSDKCPERYTIFRLFNTIALAQSFAVIVIIMRKSTYFKGGGKGLVRALQILMVGSIVAVSIAHATIDVGYHHFKMNVPCLIVIFLLSSEFVTFLQRFFSKFGKTTEKPNNIHNSANASSLSCKTYIVLQLVFRLVIIVGLTILSYKDSTAPTHSEHMTYKVSLIILSMIGITLWWFGINTSFHSTS